ncbi:MAG: virulence factor [candidate division KSB1 bacterium]|nr:virulence factor [candidate division KSB1 bacterium]MDZ7273969.1 virulence factor [candidate division KSB1 bacterium]MDZ7286342.1 virulence factor [candidate division KSB1 bacterium]MDZ7296570.1 virulence factor [candidate division KSB1 bacterium]MDZ7306103.1 virulence factor [candidate division KSB1 bacterium]
MILIGYSFGADVLPFVVNRLPDELRAKVELIVFLGSSTTAQFEFHLANWRGSTEQRTRFMVQPEIEKLRNMRMLCVCGEQEKDSLCQKPAPGLAKTMIRKGSHHLDGNYAPVAEENLKEVQ